LPARELQAARRREALHASCGQLRATRGEGKMNEPTADGTTAPGVSAEPTKRTRSRHKLTDALVERLPVPAKGRAVYFDQKTRGLCVRVSATGERSFYLVRTVPETKAKAWVRLGDAGSLSLEGARRAAQVEAGKIARGVDPNAERREKRAAAERAKAQASDQNAAPTVAGLVRSYITARERQLSPVTHHEYLRTLRVDIEPSALGKMKAREALRSHVRDFHAKLGRGGKHQADRALVLLRAAYRWGQDEEVAPDVALVDRDPTRGIEPFMKGSAKVRTHSLVNPRGKNEGDTWAEVVRFWKGTEGLHVVPCAFARLLLLLGMRRGEAAAALWSDIDLDGDPCVWHVRAELRKGRTRGSAGERKPLDVPLPTLAVTILRQLREHVQGERVFRGGYFSVGNVGALVKKATGMDDLRLHDLRRSTASGLQRIGAPAHVIAAALGHVETGGAQADRSYTHGGRFEEHRVWLEKWAEQVARLVGEGEAGKLIAFPGRT
jgi:integrase